MSAPVNTPPRRRAASPTGRAHGMPRRATSIPSPVMSRSSSDRGPASAPSHATVRARAAVRPLLTAGLLAATLAACGTAGGSAADGAAARPAGAAGTAPSDPAGVLSLGPSDVVRAVAGPVAAGITVTGSLDPADRVEIKAQLAGQLDRVLVERGTVVRRGQTLAVYDAGALRAQDASARAALAARERDLGAADTLYKRGAASQQDFVNARVARDAARAQLTQARETLARATVAAPIGGQVSDKLVSSGEAVQPGTQLFTIVNNDVLELTGQVGADQIGRVRVGQPVRLTLEAYPGRVLSGRVDRLDPVADPATRQVTAYVRVDNRVAGVVGGLFATGVILSGAESQVAAGAVAVPAAAVRQEGGAPVVYAIENDRVRRRPVTVGVRDAQSGAVEVRAGLAAGTLVLVAPGSPPRDGTPVRLATAVATGADAARPATTEGR